MNDLSAELRERALAFMKNVAQRSADPFYTCDPEDDFRFVFVNDAACTHFGRRREELLATSLTEVDARLSRAQWKRLWEELQEKGALFFETVHRYADGREIPVAISANFFSFAGRDLFGGCIHNLEAREEAEQALRESEEMLRLIFNCSRDAIVLHAVDGKIIDFNEPFLRLHGVSRDEALRLSIDDFAANGTAEVAQQARIYWERTVAGEPQLFVWPSRRAGDHSLFLAEVSLRQVTLRGESVILAQVRDLSEQRQAEEVLRHGEKRLLQTRDLLQSLIDGSPNLVAAVDPDLRFLIFNRAFVDILQQRYGITPHLRQSLAELLVDHPAELAQVQPLWERALGGESFSVTVQFSDASKARRIYDMRFSPVRAPDGHLLGAAHISTEVSERIAAEQALQQAKEAAEEGNRIKSAFLANVSHELRTPLTVILGTLDLLVDSEPTESQGMLLDLAQNGGQQLLSIIEDLLDFSRIEGGRITLHKESFNLPGCLRQVREMFLLPARRRGLALHLTIDPEVPELVVGDPNRLTQVLVNLVGNALKFTEQGEIVLAAAPAGGEQVLLSVRDTGIGIEPDRQMEIFEPFTQADVSSTRRFGGTGLGLAISRELVHLMGGELGVESRPGAGSTFICRLPLPPAEVTPYEAPGSKTPAPAPAAGRLLIAEDDPAIRALLRLMLAPSGWQVEMAADGEEAIEKWQSGHFDLVLMDLQMPRLDGLAATRRIRALEQGQVRHTCIIALTAHAGSEAREQCEAAGMDDFIAKPVRAPDLMAVLSTCLADRPE